jgi:Tfp pilus assembly PilM family ATPase
MPFQKLVRARLPAVAVGIESNSASVVQIDRARGGFVIRRAAALHLTPEVIKPSFDQLNITDGTAVAQALTDLVTSAGLLRQRKFSAALPEAAIRSAIVTIEGTSGSRRETEEMFEWKVERSFGAPIPELRISRESMIPDAQRHARFLVNAVRREVLAEYESLFRSLRWHVGLILPRHTGEEQWLRNGKHGDGLLLTAHDEGFTAVLMRGEKPLAVRTVFCEPEEREDELHRILLFYRDRVGTSTSLERLLILGDRVDKERVAAIVGEAFGVNLKPLKAADVGLTVPTNNLDFDAIAAPAGLARMAW